MKERYHISGMTCSACSAHVEKAVKKLEGVEKASVNLLTETMEIEYDESRLDWDRIATAVEKAGYGASLIIGGSGERKEAPADKSAAGTKAAENGSVGRKSPAGGRDSVQKKAERESIVMKRRLWVSVVFLIPLMYVSMHHMLKEWFGLPVPGFVQTYLHGNENAMSFALTQFLLLLPIVYMNRKFFIVGFRTLFRLSPNMDSLIALGSSAAIGYGIFAMYRIGWGLGHGDMAAVEQYSHDLYFESAGTILTLITVGKYLESRSKKKTSEAITKLMDLSPKTALVLREDGTEEEVPTEFLREGDIFLVKPGSLVPVDGTVLEGNSSIDEAAITGESVPVEKHAGDRVVSATVNKSGFLKCRADRVGEDTTLSTIIRLVEEASASKAPIAQLADKVAGIFVPVVIAIAIVTLILWLIAGAGAEFAISCAIAVLVISCPCALGLATPVAIMVGTGVGASNGILIKSGEALQRAKEIDTVVLDKTGTITSGELRVMGTGCYVQDMSLNTMVQIAAALEKKSEHPLAEAVVEYAKKDGLDELKIRDFKAVFGRGVEGVLEEAIPPRPLHPSGDGPTAFFVAGKNRQGKREVSFAVQKDAGVKAGTRVFVGNIAYMEENGIAIDRMVRQGLDEIAAEGMTPLLVAQEGRLLGNIEVADEIKASSVEAIQSLKKMGIHVVMLTGDNKRTAEAVRRMTGIEEAVAEVLPQDKEKHVRALMDQGRRVAMIGDGINDAPALVAADVGMAIGAGTDVAMESADIVLMKSDLRDAVTAVKLSRAVIRNIRQNLFWAFFYNAIGIPLAAGVWYPVFGWKLNPMFGAAAMSLSSIFVVGNALRLKSFQSETRAQGTKSRTGKQQKEKQQTEKQQTETAKAEKDSRQKTEKQERVEKTLKEKREKTGKQQTEQSKAGNEKQKKAEVVDIKTNKSKNRKSGQEREDKTMTKTMTIEGMMCAHCTGRVQKALEAVEGVKNVNVSLENKAAAVEFEGEVSDDALSAAVTEAGYEVKSIR